MIAIDTNLLVYAHRSGLPEHRASQRVLSRASEDRRGWGVALQSLAEFWSVVTHPSSAGGPSTSKQASGFLKELLAGGGARVFLPGERFAERLLDAATSLEVSGPRVFDLQIALAAVDGGATEIWTHDARFLSMPGLRVVDPL